MKYFVTGGAGFIGSNLVDRLLENGNEVVVYDDFSTGKRLFFSTARIDNSFSLIEGDVLDFDRLSQSMNGCDFVFHLSANADVRHGLEHTRKDLNQNTIATYNVLESMRKNGINNIAFSSTGSIYGESKEIPTPEDAKFPIQTSLYGASKLACEGLIQAYCEGFNFQSWIFRFVSILGERYSHGHMFDFYQQLLEHPTYLNVLGNGEQKKSYLYVQDCIDGMLFAIRKSHEKVNIFNLGTPEFCELDDSIEYICDYLNIPESDFNINYSGGERGWVGDVPFIYLDISKIRGLGWKPKKTIKESIEITVDYLRKNKWLLERRK